MMHYQLRTLNRTCGRSSCGSVHFVWAPIQFRLFAFKQHPWCSCAPGINYVFFKTHSQAHTKMDTHTYPISPFFLFFFQQGQTVEESNVGESQETVNNTNVLSDPVITLKSVSGGRCRRHRSPNTLALCFAFLQHILWPCCRGAPERTTVASVFRARNEQLGRTLAGRTHKHTHTCIHTHRPTHTHTYTSATPPICVDVQIHPKHR